MALDGRRAGGEHDLEHVAGMGGAGDGSRSVVEAVEEVFDEHAALQVLGAVGTGEADRRRCDPSGCPGGGIESEQLECRLGSGSVDQQRSGVAVQLRVCGLFVATTLNVASRVTKQESPKSKSKMVLSCSVTSNSTPSNGPPRAVRVGVVMPEKADTRRTGPSTPVMRCSPYAPRSSNGPAPCW